MAICDEFGRFTTTAGACGVALRCSSAQIEALVGPNPVLENNCPKKTDPDVEVYMTEGQSCRAKCPLNYDTVGGFLCSLGEVVGHAGCISKDGDLTAVPAKVIAGQVRMTIDDGASTIDSLASRLSDSLANVLGTQIGSVKLLNSAGQVVSNSTGGRRLALLNRRLAELVDYDLGTAERRLATGTYSAAYEAVVLATSSASAEDVARKAAAMAQPGSDEQAAFVGHATSQGLGVTNMVVESAPRIIATTVPVNSMGVVVPLDRNADSKVSGPMAQGGGTTTEAVADAGAIVGGIFGGLAGLACISSLCYGWCLMRKRLRES